MHDVITSIEQATPAWLTNVLREGGHLAAEQVHTVTVTGIHAEQVHSISYFLALGYGPSAHSGLPTRLFLKLPRPGTDLTIAAAIGEREVGMYRMFAAHQHALPIVSCYSAAYAPTAQSYHLLLDDLSTTHDQPAWHLEIAEHYITETIDCLAQFRAYWWEHPSLYQLSESLPHQEEGTAEMTTLQQALPMFLNTLGDSLTRADRHVYEHTLAALPQVCAARTMQPRQTLVHGDAHFWNFLYPLDPHMHRTRLLDWQCVHTGMGVEDVAYTIILRYPHRTAANEHALVQRYHHQLKAHGVTNMIGANVGQRTAAPPWSTCSRPCGTGWAACRIRFGILLCHGHLLLRMSWVVLSLLPLCNCCGVLLWWSKGQWRCAMQVNTTRTKGG